MVPIYKLSPQLGYKLLEWIPKPSRDLHMEMCDDYQGSGLVAKFRIHLL